ncbi:MAG: bifunctional hydroxymethylpyrimidine kinase/phosphomethylpyrimidine kinase [Deltaproteobacteria bacterium]|nr:MAG: bifunctional hydroxymethylpyrimidine kinase/phosphomethylpyrimidine kinase [Deltaproteobacteria bacterium]
MRPVVLTIAGSDPGGGAGIQVDLETITVLGGHGVSVITALTAQNTQGVRGVEPVRIGFIEEQLEAILEDMTPSAAKTGMLWGKEVVEVVSLKLREHNVRNLVVDPVMVAKGGERLLKEEASEALVRELLPLAEVVTPNLPEAEILAGMQIRCREEMTEAARRIRDLGPRAVLLKGGHLEGDPVDLLLDEEGELWLEGRRTGPQDVHGTGCVFSSALATFLARGLGLREAAQRAKAFVSEGIRGAKAPGKGRFTVDPFFPVERELARWPVVEALRRAYSRLRSAEVGWLIPEVGSNLVYAMPGARSPEEVAGFEGRLVRLGRGVARVGEVSFGASRHMASVVLEAMKKDPSFRSAMNVKFGEEVLEAASRAGLTMASFRREEEPVEIREREGATLPWGVGRALEGRSDVPDLVYDRGGWGKEPMVRVLGRTPDDVVEKVLEIHRRRDG